MNLPDIILSVLAITFSAAVIFISAVKGYSGFSKITEWIILLSGFIFHFAVLYGVFYFLVTGVNPKGFMPIFSILLLLILPLAAVISVIGYNRIKSFVLNFIK